MRYMYIIMMSMSNLRRIKEMKNGLAKSEEQTEILYNV